MSKLPGFIPVSELIILLLLPTRAAILPTKFPPPIFDETIFQALSATGTIREEPTAEVEEDEGVVADAAAFDSLSLVLICGAAYIVYKKLSS